MDKAIPLISIVDDSNLRSYSQNMCSNLKQYNF